MRENGLAMALKKSQLYSSLWASCDELRGGMDASQYVDKCLEERYAEPLPEIMRRVGEFEAKVEQHLANMGLQL